MTVGDKLWLFACVEGSDNEGWGLPKPSRMTPAEACFYLGIDNLIMVEWEEKPAPPYHRYAIPFRPLKQLVWSVVGSGGQPLELAPIKELARSMHNIRGVMMDDFFNGFEENGQPSMDVDQLARLKHNLVVDGCPLDLWVVIYTHQLHLPVEWYLELCNVVTLWTWNSSDLVDLEDNLRRLEVLAPRSRKILGLYMWDYGEKKPVSVEDMEMQCVQGLEWLRQGRIDGMVFLANTVADLDLEAVEWSRQWIREVKDIDLVT